MKPLSIYCISIPLEVRLFLEALNPNDKISLATGLLNQADESINPQKSLPSLPSWDVLKKE